MTPAPLFLTSHYYVSINTISSRLVHRIDVYRLSAPLVQVRHAPLCSILRSLAQSVVALRTSYRFTVPRGPYSFQSSATQIMRNWSHIWRFWISIFGFRQGLFPMEKCSLSSIHRNILQRRRVFSNCFRRGSRGGVGFADVTLGRR